MRFYLTFELEKSSLPKDYRRIILSYIKKSLTEILDGRYYSQYFKDNIQKDFCFSLKLPKAKFTKDDIILEEINKKLDEEIKIRKAMQKEQEQKTKAILQKLSKLQEYNEINDMRAIFMSKQIQNILEKLY